MKRAEPRAPIVERSLPTDPAVRSSPSLYLTEAERQGVTGSRRMLYVGTEACPSHVAARLTVTAGDPVLVRRKLMLADDVPMRIATSYFPAALAEDTRLTAPDFVPGGLQGVLEDLGFRFGRAEETLTARLATPAEVETLDLAAGAPVVQVLRSSYDTSSAHLHTLETICAADRHVFRVQQVTGNDAF